MSNCEEWSEFLGNLFSHALAEHKKTKEYEYRKQRKGQISEYLDTNLTVDQKQFVEEILCEMGLAAERETEVVYHQGLKDCVWLLKTLGVLA